MAMEAIKGAGMAYQGSVQTAAQTDSQAKVDAATGAGVTDTATAAPKTEASTASDDAGSNSQNTEASSEQIRKAVDEVNKKAVDSEAIFGIHEATNRVTIKIVDKNTRKVIKEIPPEKTLDMIAKVWELAGLMVDEKR